MALFMESGSPFRVGPQGSRTDSRSRRLRFFDLDGLDRGCRRSPAHRVTLREGPHDVHTLGDLTEDRMPAVEVWLRIVANEELAPVAVRSGVRHRERALLVFLRAEFVLKRIARASATAAGR